MAVQSKKSKKTTQSGDKVKKIEKSKKSQKAEKKSPVVTEEEKAAIANMASVEDLFSSSFFDDKQQDDDAVSESSEDGFVGGADIDMDDEEEEEEEDENEGKSHMAELEALKQTDPSFYKYLMENEKNLLDFAVEDEDEDVEDDEEMEVDQTSEKKPDQEKKSKKEKKAKTEKKDEPVNDSGLLTMKRFELLSGNAEKGSQHGIQILLAAFKAAIRSSEEIDEKAAMAQLKARQGRPVRRKTLRVDDPEVFSALLLWMFEHFLPLISKRAGEPKTKMNIKTAPKYKSVARMARVFWGEALFVLRHFTEANMIEPLIRLTGSIECMQFLWPIEKIQPMVLKRVVELWATHASQKLRLMCFLMIRNLNTVGMAMAPNLTERAKVAENIVRSMYKQYALAAMLIKSNITWATLSRFRFLENCIAELLNCDENMAYRVGYTSLRQLALVLRSVVLLSGKTSQKKGIVDRTLSTVFGWSFIRGCSLWSHALASVPGLKPLAYPLLTIMSCALNFKLSCVDWAPYCYHLIRLMNDVAAGMKQFVPVGAYLLKMLHHSIHVADKAKHNTRRKTQEMVSKLVDVDLLIKLNKQQQGDFQALSSVVYHGIFLLTDHLGLLAQSPAFPEITAPVTAALRRQAKNCWLDAARHDMRDLVQLIETTNAEIVLKRDALTALPSLDQFLLFEGTALAKKRDALRRRKAAEEVAKISADAKTSSDEPGTLDSGDLVAEKPKANKNKKNRKKAQDAKKAAYDAAVAEMPVDADELEELQFSDDSDEE